MIKNVDPVVFRIPPPIMNGTATNFPIGHLTFKGENTEKASGRFKDDEKTEWLLGHRLPPFQRPPVWSQEQSIKFIESAWLGVHLGIYVINMTDTWHGNFVHCTDLWIIDGQQRLRAISGYIHDEFPVFELLYSELNKVEKRKFDAIPFSCNIVKEDDEKKLRKLYDIMNFGGTTHTEDQRAT